MPCEAIPQGTLSQTYFVSLIHLVFMRVAVVLFFKLYSCLKVKHGQRCFAKNPQHKKEYAKINDGDDEPKKRDIKH